jgi:hypothetical protein
MNGALHKVYRFLFVKKKKKSLEEILEEIQKPVTQDPDVNPDLIKQTVESREPIVKPIEAESTDPPWVQPQPIVKEAVVKKSGLFHWLKQKIPWLQEQVTIAETGMTTRQRVKRYNAIMEGNLGAPEKNAAIKKK